MVSANIILKNRKSVRIIYHPEMNYERKITWRGGEEEDEEEGDEKALTMLTLS